MPFFLSWIRNHRIPDLSDIVNHAIQYPLYICLRFCPKRETIKPFAGSDITKNRFYNTHFLCIVFKKRINPLYFPVYVLNPFLLLFRYIIAIRLSTESCFECRSSNWFESCSNFAFFFSISTNVLLHSFAALDVSLHPSIANTVFPIRSNSSHTRRS